MNQFVVDVLMRILRNSDYGFLKKLLSDDRWDSCAEDLGSFPSPPCDGRGSRGG
jgi:hypothetical protein